MTNLSIDMTALRFSGVRKEFKSFLPRRRILAVEDLDLEVRPGEIVGLVGPNGSGKTTTFRLAAGLLDPDAGTIALFGLAPGSRAARSRQGYMPEQPGVPERLTPAELLHFVGRVAGMDRRARADRIDELTQLLSLSDFVGRRMAGFSKGMIKRTGLAAAFFARPDLLLLDEPLEGVDPLGAAAVKDHLAELAGQGCAILVSSHILTDVEALCSALLVVNKGRVLLAGAKDDILSLRDLVEVRFSAPDEDDVVGRIRELVERCKGEVLGVGRPRENLEGLFGRLIGSDSGGRGKE